MSLMLFEGMRQGFSIVIYAVTAILAVETVALRIRDRDRSMDETMRPDVPA